MAGVSCDGKETVDQSDRQPSLFDAQPKQVTGVDFLRRRSMLQRWMDSHKYLCTRIESHPPVAADHSRTGGEC